MNKTHKVLTLGFLFVTSGAPASQKKTTDSTPIRSLLTLQAETKEKAEEQKRRFKEGKDYAALYTAIMGNPKLVVQQAREQVKVSGINDTAICTIIDDYLRNDWHDEPVIIRFNELTIPMGDGLEMIVLPNGKIAALYDKTIYIVDTKNTDQRAKIDIVTAEGDFITACTVKDNTIIVGTDKGIVTCLNSCTLEKPLQLLTLNGAIGACTALSDGTLAVATGKSLNIIDVSDRKNDIEFKEKTAHTITTIKELADGTLLCLDDGLKHNRQHTIFYIFNPKSPNAKPQQCAGDDKEILGLTFLNNNECVTSSRQDLKLLNLSKNLTATTLYKNSSRTPLRPSHVRPTPLKLLDGRIACGFNDSSIKFIDSKNPQKEPDSFKSSYIQRIWNLAQLPDGQLVTTSGASLLLWPTTAHVIKKLLGDLQKKQK